VSVLEQRVCDLESCRQPITAETMVIFVAPQNGEGTIDPARMVEFHTSKCSRTWTRQMEASLKDVSITEQIKALTGSAAEKASKTEKLEEGRSDLKTPVVFPQAA